MNEEFKLMNLKGTSDFFPEEQIIRNRITDTLKGVFELYGFLPLETPILCYYDLLASKYAGGAEILKEVEEEVLKQIRNNNIFLGTVGVIAPLEILVPADYVALYKDAFGWKTYADYIKAI